MKNDCWNSIQNFLWNLMVENKKKAFKVEWIVIINKGSIKIHSPS